MSELPKTKTSTSLSRQVSAFGHTDVGRKRKNNEDCFALASLAVPSAESLPQAAVSGPVFEAGLLLIVADGMGGAEAGEVASRLAVETMIAELRAKSVGIGSMQMLLKAAVAAAHAKVFSTGEATPGQKGMGCTLSVLWLRPGRAALAQVGDSRIYRWRAGKIGQLTLDQTVVQGMLLRGEITPEQAKQARFRGILEHVIGGTGEAPLPQIEEFDYAEGDRFLLCSDGCHDCLDIADLAGYLGASSFDPAACARESVAEACRRSGHDNITVIAAACEAPRAGLLSRLARWVGLR